mmetsp:Transcript_1384/g.2984  ORF Transcript_1384/g.2984 Transcript_1384/m.2984 type:complete len:81 (+) Transcript_1384:483-725(+)
MAILWRSRGRAEDPDGLYLDMLFMSDMDRGNAWGRAPRDGTGAKQAAGDAKDRYRAAVDVPRIIAPGRGAENNPIWNAVG